jgi:hypothetical protein
VEQLPAARRHKTCSHLLSFRDAFGEKTFDLAGKRFLPPVEMTKACHFEPLCGEKSFGTAGKDFHPAGTMSVAQNVPSR